MTMANYGGPAFPAPVVVQIDAGKFSYAPTGMTLRDYFASLALAAIITHEGPGEEDRVDAQRAYDYADSMLAEREKC